MSKINRKIVIIGIIVAILLAVAGVFYYNDHKTYKYITFSKFEGSEQEIHTINVNSKGIYDETVVKEVDKYLNSNNNYTFEEPFIVYNPYGIYTNSLYIKFNTYEKTKLRYTIKSEGVVDFSRVLMCGNESLVTNHENTIIGLVANSDNTVILELLNEKDEIVKKSQFEIKASQLAEPKAPKLEVTKDTSTTLSDGLYVVIPNEEKNTYFVDNDGVIRNEIVSNGYRVDNLKFDGNKNVLFAISETQMVRVNNKGRIIDIYDLGKYGNHHDFDLIDDNNCIILASDLDVKKSSLEKEDRIIKLNLENHKIEYVLDMATLLGEYKNITNTCVDYTEQETLDWIHLNSIQYLGSNTILVSARESSSIIKISNIFESPKIDYIIADEKIYENTSYSSLVLKKDGSFNSQAGQHTAFFVDTNSKDKKHYIYCFNNNYWSYESRNGFIYQIPGTGEYTSQDVKSMIYKYEINEEKKTYKLVDKIDVDYSPLMSSVQLLSGDNILSCSATALKFSELSKDKKVLATFTTSKQIYRTFKYTFKNIWFE